MEDSLLNFKSSGEKIVNNFKSEVQALQTESGSIDFKQIKAPQKEAIARLKTLLKRTCFETSSAVSTIVANPSIFAHAEVLNLLAFSGSHFPMTVESQIVSDEILTKIRAQKDIFVERIRIIVRDATFDFYDIPTDTVEGLDQKSLDEVYEIHLLLLKIQSEREAMLNDQDEGVFKYGPLGSDKKADYEWFAALLEKCNEIINRENAERNQREAKQKELKYARNLAIWQMVFGGNLTPPHLEKFRFPPKK